MKRRICTYVAMIVLAATVFLNLTIQSKAEQLIATSGAKSPQIRNCQDSSGDVYAYATNCVKGTASCVGSTCPKEPATTAQ